MAEYKVAARRTISTGRIKFSAGSIVTPEKLKISEEQFKTLIKDGSVILIPGSIKATVEKVEITKPEIKKDFAPEVKKDEPIEPVNEPIKPASIFDKEEVKPEIKINRKGRNR